MRKKLGDVLLERGLITEEQLQIGLKDQQEREMRLGDALLNRQFITERQLLDALSDQLGIPQVILNRERIEEKIIHLIPQRTAESYLVLPLKLEDGKLTVAMADPLDYLAIDEIRMATGFAVEPVIASRSELEQAIQRHYGLQESIDQVMNHLRREQLRKTPPAVPESDSPVVRTVNQMIDQAVQWEASDIHIDPQENNIRVRYRIDGMMRDVRSLPIHMLDVIVARVKIMAELDVAERRIPQDGRIQMDAGTRTVDIRVSTLPTIHGEKIVMRILDPLQDISQVEALGFSPPNLEKFLNALQQSRGMVLITGPTGSGKTTTLYSALHRLNKEDVNIITIEDPVEYQVQGLNQVQVNPSVGLTFAHGLRAILRQDPNILMVGEIRDLETAEIAVRAAMTGHLVLSTIHTNHAVNTVTRLIDMGVEPFLIASSLTCIVAQRLVRKVCSLCAEERLPTDEEKKSFEEYGIQVERLREGAGCQLCGFTGYRGRIAIHEVLAVDAGLRKLIMQRRSDQEYVEYAVLHGMVPMVTDGLTKAAAGITTVSEVYRVAFNT